MYRDTDMMTHKRQPSLDATRSAIAQQVRALRKERRFTQAELAAQLGLSQSRLSELEQGAGSFTAEQFVRLLQLFNVDLHRLVPNSTQRQDETLQNALARLGAAHLQESPDVLPSERLTEVGDVLREVLIAAESPRQIAALVPLLVANIRRFNLRRAWLQFVDAGWERRLAWLFENALEAIRRDEQPGLPRRWVLLYRRTQVVLSLFLEPLKAESPRWAALSPDIMDPDIRSRKSVEEVTAASSDISKRWGIVTGLQPEDFVEALRAARVGR